MMSAIVQPEPLITTCSVFYTKPVLDWKYQTSAPIGQLFKVSGFIKHNWLIDINQIFSSNPAGMLADRTQTVNTPLKFHVPRPWKPPATSYTLEQALESRVANLTSRDQNINLFWSGGVDSTTMLTAFLKHARDLQQLRIFYTPYSTYEHPEYFDFLKQFRGPELIDLSGTTYSSQVFDGLFVTGDGGDELMASVDESFFQRHGRHSLDRPWPDFFFEHFPDESFVNFCHDYFAQSGRAIDTVLEARWFFYAMCKTRYQLLGKIDLFAHYPDFDPDRLQGFFDCVEFENYIYWNLDHIIPGDKYSEWKLPFKKYCVKFDGFQNYFDHKQKQGSGQTHWYANKNKIMHDRRSIFILSNGQRVATASLPLLSRREFENTYGNTLDYLFNEPDQL